MIYIVRGQNTGPSARSLAEGLTARGKCVRLLRDASCVDGFTVNWSGTPQYADVNAHTETDKLRQLWKLAEAGVRTPRFTTYDPGGSWMPRTVLHSMGSDFRGYINADYWTEPIRSYREWRAHVAVTDQGTRVVRLGFKTLTEPHLSYNWNRDEGFPIRSRTFGWRIKYYRTDESWLHKLPAGMDILDLYDQATGTIDALGWNIGAVDIVQDSARRAWVLEANACPGLKDEKTCDVYLDYIEGRMDDNVQ